ncbi:hypothetical protein [Devosia sp. Root105]|uniref:hypothetical protein n=1 Tax=Devosia sp. Root105 TaxID=1736423 RepID=UPI0006FD82BC|nr:hypothetical protein [Devosia sp. Root105]KQU96448.1 hypothetical protein ASC68_13805 [Devosia sp. Root105]
MPFSFVYQPLNRIAGVHPKTAEFETATKCLKAIDDFEHSDERVSDIRDASGRLIGKRELTLLAEAEKKS